MPELVEPSQPQPQLLEYLLNHLSAGVTVSDMQADDQPVVFVNDGFLRLTGFTRDEVVGRNCRFLQTSATDADKVAGIREAIEAGRPHETVIRNRRADGSEFWNRLQLYPLRDDEGRVIQYVGIQTDVSAEIDAGTTLKAHDHLLDKLSRLSPGVLLRMEIDATGYSRICYAGKRATTVLGCSPSRLLQLDDWVSHLVQLSDVPQVRDLLADSARTGKTLVCEFRASLPAQQECWLRLEASRDDDDCGSDWYGFVSDVTQQHRQRKLLQLAGNVLAENDAAVLITDEKGVILDVNGAFTDITGYSRKEAVGRRPSFLSAGLHDDAYYAQMWQSLILDGRWNGELKNRRKSGEIYTERIQIHALTGGSGRERGVTHYVATFVDIGRAGDRRSHSLEINFYDPLTNLPQREMLLDRVRVAQLAAQHDHSLTALLVLDIDNFTRVNERYGRAAGDSILVAIASRVQDCLRASDLLSRVCGDRFAVLLSGLRRAAEIEHLAERIIAAVEQPLVVDGDTVSLVVSSGVAVHQGGDRGNAERQLRHAEQALLAARSEPSHKPGYFDSGADVRLRERRERMHEIVHAMQHDEFCLFYQPKVSLFSGAVVGFEALARWQHPERGLLSPAEFMPFIDESSLNTEFSCWVLNRAASQMRTWREAGHDLAVSINVSIATAYFSTERFLASLDECLQHDPALIDQGLEVEIVENSQFADADRVRDFVDACRQRMIRVSLDDFGTGQSSLSNLSRLRVDTLKIDRSFIGGMLDKPEDLALTEGVLSLASVFGLQTVAEGVESVLDGVALIQFGCDIAQGYVIAAPMPAAAVAEWIAQWQPPAAWRLAHRYQLPREDWGLTVGGQIHLRQLNQLLAWSPSGQALHPQTSALAQDYSPLRAWIQGIGARRHGRRPEFVALCSAHAELDTALAVIRAEVCAGRSAREIPPPLVAQFKAAHEAFRDAQARFVAVIACCPDRDEPLPAHLVELSAIAHPETASRIPAATVTPVP